MLDLDGLGAIQRVRWPDLAAGMIYVGGIRVNDTVPQELRDYPLVTPGLLSRLRDTYRLRPEREILAIPVRPDYDPRKAAQRLRRAVRGLDLLNGLLGQYDSIRKKVLIDLGVDPNTPIPILGSPAVDTQALILDSYNSFVVPIRRPTPPLPSFLGRAGLKLTIADLLAGRLEDKIRLPRDSEVLLHLVVDYSFSMKGSGKDQIVTAVLNLFYRYVAEFLLATRIRLYVFSDECRCVDYPLSGREIERKETCFSAFMKRVLHHRDPERHNTVLLFTDGMPTDGAESLRLAELFRKNRIDYTQLVFAVKDDLRHVADGVRPDNVVDGFVEEGEGGRTRVLTEAELDERLGHIRTTFTQLARAGGGNQVIFSIDEAAGAIAVECYDRYLGLLTLATAPVVEAVEATRADSPRAAAAREPAGPGDPPRVRKATFPTLSRKKPG